MKARHGWAAVAAVAAAVLGAAPGEAQERRCDDGRGALVTDLGFRGLIGPIRIDTRHPGVTEGFEAEPRIRGVRAAGPAAGRLREGDVLVAVDGEPITTRQGARRYSAVDPGERVRLSVRRGGRVQDVTVVAMARCIAVPPAPPAPPAAPVALAPPAPPAPPPPPPPLPPMDEIMPEGWLGFTIDCRDCGMDGSHGARNFRFREPLVVASVEPGSPAARAGLRRGDRLTHLDGVPLTSGAGWPRFYAIQPGEEVRFTYTRAGRPHQATVSALHRPE